MERIKKFVRAAVAGAMLTGAPNMAKAEAQRPVAVEVRLESTPNTKWAAELVKEAAGDVSKLKTKRDVELWTGAFPSQLSDGYLTNLEQREFSPKDLAALYQLTGEMFKLIGRVQARHGILLKSTVNQRMDAMVASLEDRLSTARKSTSSGPVAKK
ncbi:hypothetical protein FJZ48_02340 [Candidatus Uhrbacteria bacterium]|nr:hypothetical protein [Candidatus Uhrbacteria bacterium]